MEIHVCVLFRDSECWIVRAFRSQQDLTVSLAEYLLDNGVVVENPTMQNLLVALHDELLLIPVYECVEIE